MQGAHRSTRSRIDRIARRDHRANRCITRRIGEKDVARAEPVYESNDARADAFRNERRRPDDKLLRRYGKRRGSCGKRAGRQTDRTVRPRFEPRARDYLADSKRLQCSGVARPFVPRQRHIHRKSWKVLIDHRNAAGIAVRVGIGSIAFSGAQLQRLKCRKQRDPKERRRAGHGVRIGSGADPKVAGWMHDPRYRKRDARR